MVAMAVPILDERGRYVASLAFHGPIQRLTYEDAWSKRQVLIDGARLMRDVLFE
jgi:DNA-binding IclR family transcriptional regulator